MIISSLCCLLDSLRNLVVIATQVPAQFVRRAKDSHKLWYKPTISRDEAVSALKNATPGSFLVRDSNSFPGAFGLALKVSNPPQGSTPSDPDELVRHFLIEPTKKGVKLKGYANEPVFASLSALIYQHTVTSLALPQLLVLPAFDLVTSSSLSVTSGKSDVAGSERMQLQQVRSLKQFFYPFFSPSCAECNDT